MMRIRRAVGYAAVFIAGFLTAVLVRQFAPERPLPQPVAEAIPSIFPQDQTAVIDRWKVLQTNSVMIVTQMEQQLRLQRHPVTGFVEKPFLYDGLRPQDLERMNPPRRVPGMVTPPPPNELKN